MKYIHHLVALSFAGLLASCSGGDEPECPVFMQPSSIIADGAEGGNQAFEYDSYGRIVKWALKYNDNNMVVAQYQYPDDNTISVHAEEVLPTGRRHYDETIRLVNGRAVESEGTFIYSQPDDAWELRKTYRLEFEYDPSNHLNAVKHMEVTGIGDDVSPSAWEKPWTWENYLIWEDGNLKEFQDFGGHSSVYHTTRYDYSIYAVEYPVIVPNVINSVHHLPVFMQGYFGLNSVNLVKSSSLFDENGSLSYSSSYTYEFEQARITEYVETTSWYSGPVSYKVNWTAR